MTSSLWIADLLLSDKELALELVCEFKVWTACLRLLVLGYLLLRISCRRRHVLHGCLLRSFLSSLLLDHGHGLVPVERALGGLGTRDQVRLTHYFDVVMIVDVDWGHLFPDIISLSILSKLDG